MLSQKDHATDVLFIFFFCLTVESVGYWSNVAGHIDGSCVSCNLGKYLNIAGQTVETACFECPRGWMQPESGQAFCLPCDAGKYANGTGTKACKECAKGKHQDAPGNATCLDCKVGQYSSRHYWQLGVHRARYVQYETGEGVPRYRTLCPSQAKERRCGSCPNGRNSSTCLISDASLGCLHHRYT